MATIFIFILLPSIFQALEIRKNKNIEQKEKTNKNKQPLQIFKTWRNK